MAVGLADNRDLRRQQSLPDWVGGFMRTDHWLDVGDGGAAKRGFGVHRLPQIPTGAW